MAKAVWSERRFWVLDLELTGLDSSEGHILSAGWVAIEGGEIQLSQAGHCLFRQSALMGDDVLDSAHLHHITDQQREDGVELSGWLAQAIDEHADDLWVFHHAPLDSAFLQESCRRFQLKWPKPQTLDTMAFEHRRLPRDVPPGYRDLTLNACRRRYGLPVYRAHHALSDALGTAELLLAQIRSRVGPQASQRDLLRAYRTR
ncbi:3'-5' exonuclease [Saccharospirillum mangrovi]|uniref:3'-5' exonuclease n=1 Tax=Saccharospirillum mangrovi TaxID=2161747 RepID=UPI001300705F|nr:3'-5' exonuclease [Saccharospirillum mangrovi]